MPLRRHDVRSFPGALRSAAGSVALAAVLASSGSTDAVAADAPPPDERVERVERRSGDVEVRRHEYVVVVSTQPGNVHAGGRAEAAAFRAGGAVLERILAPDDPSGSTQRMLVRTRSPARLGDVLKEIRSVPGVVGANAIKLPEIETGLGSPGFLSVYTAELEGESNAGRVVVRHDVPRVLDERDLLEVVDVPVSPTIRPSDVGDTGGFTLNVSELFQRLRQGAWARRERRMKEAELPILPPDDEPRDATR